MLNYSKKVTLLMFFASLTVGSLAYWVTGNNLYFSISMIATYLVLMFTAILRNKVQYKGKLLRLRFNRK